MRLGNTGKQVVTGDWSSCDTKLFENIRKLCCEELELIFGNMRENGESFSQKSLGQGLPVFPKLIQPILIHVYISGDISEVF